MRPGGTGDAVEPEQLARLWQGAAFVGNLWDVSARRASSYGPF